METFDADVDDAQIHCNSIAGSHFTDEVDMMLKVHRPRIATAMAGIVKPDAFKNGYTGAILAEIDKAGFKIVALKKASISKKQAAVGPLGPRDRLETGSPQFLNLFRSEIWRLHFFRPYLASPGISVRNP